jgi:hypothetical protein
MQRRTVIAQTPAMVERLRSLREAHRVLARELTWTRQRLNERERELRDLRQVVERYRLLRATNTI